MTAPVFVDTSIWYAAADDSDAANSAAAAFGDQAFSLTDRISWAIMERLSIVDALAFDADSRMYRYGPQRRRAFAVRP